MREVPLKYATSINRLTLPESTDSDFQFRYVDISAVNSKGEVVVPDLVQTFDKAPSRARRLAKSGAVLVSTVRTYLRAIARVPEATSIPTVFSTGFSVLEAQLGVDQRYLYYACSSEVFVETVVARSVGVSYPAINPTELASISIPLPTLDEQRRIADFLDDQVARIDNIVAAREKQRNLIAQEQASLSDHLLDGQIWEDTTRLGRFIQRIEQGWSPQCEAVAADNHEWGVLKVSAVRQGRFVPTENKRLPDDLRPQMEYEVRGGDLFVTRANTPTLVGAFAVAPDDTRPGLIFSDKIMRLTLSDNLDPEFVSLVGQMRAVRDLLSSAGTGTSQSMVNVRGSDIRDIRVPVVDTRTQRGLVARHRGMAARIETEQGLLERQIQLISELKRSLITAAVTGELDVTVADGSRVLV